jgi:peptidoglycan/LPS O-acetylase OafA/YrhL
VASTIATTVLASIVFRWFEQPIIRFYKVKLSPVVPRAVPVSLPVPAA